MSSNTQKLRILRSRTDGDLLVLVNRELDRGLVQVDLAATRTSPLFTQALKSHDIATTLLARINVWSDDDRKRIEAKVAELRSRLNQVPMYASVRAYRTLAAS